MMEQTNNRELGQNSSEEPTRNQELVPTSEGYILDHTSCSNSNMKPPELQSLEAKPVLNYSIQTGEEFALEFMRIPKKSFKPNIASDANCTTGYLELKGMLGIGHTGSESGSDISLLTAAERGPKDNDQKKSSLYEDNSNYGSVQSIPRTSWDYNSYRGPVQEYASSGASESSSSKMKILCSFAGRILPRPSDGKLRYVGGDTRITRLSKDITWQELWQKTVNIYNQTCMIKYQLPGEDLDALVSVSSDEDLQNMMEECNVVHDGEGSKKLRMFLFSSRDLEDAHFGLQNSDFDSEIQYVVAVNGMDVGSRKSSTLHDLAGSSSYNLDEMDEQNVERDTGGATTEFVQVTASPLSSYIMTSSASASSRAIPSVYEASAQFHNGLVMQHGESKQYPLPYGHDSCPPSYLPSGESGPLPFPGLVTLDRTLTEGQPSVVLHTRDTQMQVKELILKNDGSVEEEGGDENIQPSSKECHVPSQPLDGNFRDHLQVEHASAVISAPSGELELQKSKGSRHEAVQLSSPHCAINTMQVPKADDNVCQTTIDSLPGNSDCDSMDLSYLESPVPPQRVFHSERKPREQAELLNRLSKSDDSLSTQFLINHSHSDVAQQDFNNESVNDHLTTTGQTLHKEPRAVANGTAQLQNLRQAVSNAANKKHDTNEDRVLKDDKETSHAKEKDKNLLFGDSIQPVSSFPAAGQVAFVKQYENPEYGFPDPQRSDRADNNFATDDTEGQDQTPAQSESSRLPSVGFSRSEILIDINDRFPRDFLSDVFSKAILAQGSSGVSMLQKDGAGLSVNVENQDPKHWSFFQKLAGEEFARKDVSLIDQDHFGYSSGLPKVEEEAPINYNFTPDGFSLIRMDSRINYMGDNERELPPTFGVDTAASQSDYSPQLKGSEAMHFDNFVDNARAPDSEYQDGIKDVGLPPLDPSLEDIDISSLQIIKNEDLEELRELGSGTFGTVYHGKWRGTDVAIKRIKKSCFNGRSSEQEKLTVEFWREAGILSKLHHPNVVAFYGVVQDGPGGTLATVTEYMVDGSLRHVLLRKDRHLDRRKRLIIAMEAAFGMEYLHSKNIVHFDLKCDNLLVNLKDSSRPICKVGDFGLSKIKRNTLVSGGVRGTLPWMAPELLNGSSNKVSEKVDVFSFGIVLWEILTGEEPYANMHYGAIIGGIVNNTLRPTIPSLCDPEWRRLMEQCWAPNPGARPSFTEIASRLRVMSSAKPNQRAGS
ncbi:Non-specific serine/threonine protein kinase [Bertholletia excelsa]